MGCRTGRRGHRIGDVFASHLATDFTILDSVAPQHNRGFIRLLFPARGLAAGGRASAKLIWLFVARVESTYRIDSYAIIDALAAQGPRRMFQAALHREVKFCQVASSAENI